MKSIITTLLFGFAVNAIAQTTNSERANIVVEQLTLIKEWDKTFAKSSKVEHKKVTFVNRYGITLVADMYIPKTANSKNEKLPAIAVSGPFGAVKEQSSGLYAQRLAEAGFLTIAFDPSFTGESGGTPRFMASPDINVEDFSAAVDFLTVQENVDKERIGILGVCGWGGIGISAAANDPRIKATVASTMYDLSRVAKHDYFDQGTADDRYNSRLTMAQQRTKEYAQGYYERDGGVVDPVPQDAPLFIQQYHDYYKTKRGYHVRSVNSNGGWNSTARLPMANFSFLDYAHEIRNAVMIVHGDKAHSYYMGLTAFSRLTGNNKELVVVDDATHVDLYDQVDKIPFDKIIDFYNRNLK